MAKQVSMSISEFLNPVDTKIMKIEDSFNNIDYGKIIEVVAGLIVGYGFAMYSSEIFSVFQAIVEFFI